MKFLKYTYLLLLTVCHPLLISAQSPLPVSLQKILPVDSGKYLINNTIENWKPSETAIVICDMWDRHWCPYATANVAEMAPAMNNMLAAARERGILIIHAPSECMDYYKNFPQRKKMLKFKDKRINEIAYDDSRLPS
ncbi:MAG: hypothetical protein LBR64_08835, partial [Dysgonamonadaceae bacterium]|nr:hypothetical protein [Dysgonamonadaceae bacterium]